MIVQIRLQVTISTIITAQLGQWRQPQLFSGPVSPLSFPVRYSSQLAAGPTYSWEIHDWQEGD
jgi:hypothetical protein